MTISNAEGRLLLSTGNKSELALGYCTLYGDTNGGLAVIGDGLKTEVYEMSRLFTRAQELSPWAMLDKAPQNAPWRATVQAALTRVTGVTAPALSDDTMAAANGLAVAIPCHRVVRNDGKLSSYRWGVQRKRALLEREAHA